MGQIFIPAVAFDRSYWIDSTYTYDEGLNEWIPADSGCSTLSSDEDGFPLMEGGEMGDYRVGGVIHLFHRDDTVE